MNTDFDLVVIGTGSAGWTAATRCRAAGWSVAIVDSRPFGGTCSQRGCDPKKVLVGAAQAADGYRRLQAKGIFDAAIQLEWPALMQFKRTFTDPVPENSEEALRKAGIMQLHGRAQFVGATSVRVGDETLHGRHVVIATGARPAPLPITGVEHLRTSTDFLDLDRLPKRIIFVGGGYISLEFAHVAARAGAQVQILHRGKQPLTGFDPHMVAQLVAASREQGIDIQLQTEVEAVEENADGFTVHVTQGDKEQSFHADLVVHGAGRAPEIDDLNLEAANIQREKRGVTVNDYLQSVSNPAVYAAGDAAATGLPLTPIATLDGETVAQNLLEGNKQRPNYKGTASVVFTIPPLATVGLQEAEARKQGLAFQVKHADTSEWYASRRVGLRHSGYKILVEEKSERILGAHLLGAHADEVINLFALALRFDLTASQLKEMVFAYPTGASEIASMLK